MAYERPDVPAQIPDLRDIPINQLIPLEYLNSGMVVLPPDRISLASGTGLGVRLRL
jgi:hypothetical protein